MLHRHTFSSCHDTLLLHLHTPIQFCIHAVRSRSLLGKQRSNAQEHAGKQRSDKCSACACTRCSDGKEHWSDRDGGNQIQQASRRAGGQSECCQRGCDKNTFSCKIIVSVVDTIAGTNTCTCTRAQESMRAETLTESAAVDEFVVSFTDVCLRPCVVLGSRVLLFPCSLCSVWLVVDARW